MTQLVGRCICSCLKKGVQLSANGCTLSEDHSASLRCCREMGLTARVPELLDHGGGGKLSRQMAGNLMAALGTVKILLSLADGDQQVCNRS